MRRSTALFLLITAAMVVAAPVAYAHGYHKHFRGRGYDHAPYYGPPPARFHHRPPRPAYYGPPPAYFHHRPPRSVYSAPPPVIYQQVPVYRDRYYRPQGYGSATLPIVAGGILGGIVGNEAGYGNPAAIIGGSVLGSVLGHEIARR